MNTTFPSFRVLYTILAILFAGTINLHAQIEICNNGVDDDGDDKIDLNDEDCACNNDTKLDIISNPSFEEHTGCCTVIDLNNGSPDCVDGWNMSGGSSYHNAECFGVDGDFDQNFHEFLTGVTEFSDAFIGAIALVGSDSLSHLQFFSTCFKSSLLPSKKYELKFNIYTNPDTDTQIPLRHAVYGFSDCSALTEDLDDQSLCTKGKLLGIFEITQSSYLNWQEVLVDLTFESEEINGILISSICNERISGPAKSYYLSFDDFEIFEVIGDKPLFEISGSICDGNAQISEVSGSYVTYQWYRNGIAMIDEVSSILKVPVNVLSSDSFILVVIDNNGTCINSEVINGYQFPTSEFIPIDTNVCDQNFFEIFGNRYEESGMYFFDINRSGTAGCDTSVVIFLEINEPINGDTLLIDINIDESYTFYGNEYTESGFYSAQISNSTLCDSIHYLFLSVNAIVGEICDNGIDDDGDDDIDLFDDECSCGNSLNYIKNPQANENPLVRCIIADWYFGYNYNNEQRYENCFNNELNVSLQYSHIPDRYSMRSVLNYLENDLQSNTSYELTFDLNITGGFARQIGPNPFYLALYGTNDQDLPTKYPNSISPCEVHEEYQILDSIDINSLPDDELINITFMFTPSTDIDIIMLSGICYREPQDSPDYVDPSHNLMLDNFKITKVSNIEIDTEVTISGQDNFCNEDIEICIMTVDPTHQYQWYKDNIAVDTETNACIKLSNTEGTQGAYQIQISTENECILSDPLNIVLANCECQELKIRENGSKCEREVSLLASPYEVDVTYTWIVDNDTIETGNDNRVLITNDQMSHDVSVTGTDSEGNCFESSTFSFEFDESPFTEVDTTLCFGEFIMYQGELLDSTKTYEFRYPRTGLCDSLYYIDITITNETLSDTLTYELLPEEEFQYQDSNYVNAGFYDFWIKNQYGCDSLFVLELIKEEPEIDIYFPNVFSPDGDNINDYFTGYTKSSPDIIMSELMVFDRWGNTIFSNSNLSFNDELSGWDGTFQNKKLKSDVYYFVAKISTNDESIIIKKGNITLIN